MTERNPYAGMTAEEAAGALAEIKASIKANENLVAFLASEAGKQLIEDKRDDLAGVRKRYSALDTKGNAEVVVRGLVRLQAMESLLGKEVEKYEGVEKVTIYLDKRLQLCHTMYRAIGKAESSGR